MRLVALWLCGKTHQDMQDGSEVCEVWDPLLEANPHVNFSSGLVNSWKPSAKIMKPSTETQ